MKTAFLWQCCSMSVGSFPSFLLDMKVHPDMMFASEGGGGSWKSARSKGDCVNFSLQISSKCVQGGEGVKTSKNFVDVINGCSLTLLKHARLISWCMPLRGVECHGAAAGLLMTKRARARQEVSEVESVSLPLCLSYAHCATTPGRGPPPPLPLVVVVAEGACTAVLSAEKHHVWDNLTSWNDLATSSHTVSLHSWLCTVSIQHEH